MKDINAFESLLLSLTEAGVDYMLAGGFAVNFHGYSRTTSDLDIWVRPDESNKIPIINALIKEGFPNEARKLIGDLDFSKPFSFSLGLEPMDVDIFNHITGVTFESAFPNKIPYTYSENLVVNYISLQDLIVNKMLTNRSKDKLDVETLQKIINLRKK